MRKWLPIRKIVTALITGGLSWAALRSGLDLGDDAVNQLTPLLVGLAFAYAEKDPRVSHVLDEAEDVIGGRPSWGTSEPQPDKFDPGKAQS